MNLMSWVQQVHKAAVVAIVEPVAPHAFVVCCLLLLGSSGAVQLFVVVLAPRSGTEWLRLMLAGHPLSCPPQIHRGSGPWPRA